MKFCYAYIWNKFSHNVDAYQNVYAIVSTLVPGTLVSYHFPLTKDALTV